MKGLFYFEIGDFNMSKFFIVESFELHEGQLENWKSLSQEIDEDLSRSAEGFISRESGIDADGRVYCLVKWESKAHSEAFMNRLMAMDEWEEMLKQFSSILNMETEQRQEVELF